MKGRERLPPVHLLNSVLPAVPLWLPRPSFGRRQLAASLEQAVVTDGTALTGWHDDSQSPILLAGPT